MQVSGTHGGASTAGAWTDRVLTTIEDNIGGHVALSANHLTLDAGTYRIFVASAFLAMDGVKLRLYDLTASAVLLDGMNHYGNSGTGPGAAVAILSGRFTQAAGHALAIQYWLNTAHATWGLGFAVSSGRVEIYTSVELWLES